MYVRQHIVQPEAVPCGHAGNCLPAANNSDTAVGDAKERNAFGNAACAEDGHLFAVETFGPRALVPVRGSNLSAYEDTRGSMRERARRPVHRMQPSRR